MKFTKKIFKLTARFCKDNGIYMNYREHLNFFLLNHPEIKDENDLVNFMFRNYIYNTAFLVHKEKLKDCELYVLNNTKKQIIKEFENFLKNKGVYDNFIENLNYKFFEPKMDIPIKPKHSNKKNYYYNCIMPHNFIIRAFMWSHSKNVSERTWSNLHAEWMKTYRKLIFTL